MWAWTWSEITLADPTHHWRPSWSLICQWKYQSINNSKCSPAVGDLPSPVYSTSFAPVLHLLLKMKLHVPCTANQTCSSVWIINGLRYPLVWRPRLTDRSVPTFLSHLKKKSVLFMWTLVECLISRTARFASQLHLRSAVLCFREDPLRSSCMRLWMIDCNFTQRVLNIHRSDYSAV